MIEQWVMDSLQNVMLIVLAFWICYLIAKKEDKR